jgi:hypothetical protein
MTRHRTLLIVGPVALILACGVAALILSGPRVTREKMEQVKVGTTREEVIATVGGPPGWYSSGNNGDDLVLMPRGLGYFEHEQWVCDEGELQVYFHEDRATDVLVWDVWSFDRPSLLSRLRSALGL